MINQRVVKTFGCNLAFGKQRVDLTIQKPNFPEMTLTYVNQVHVSLVKGGEKAIYCDFVILGQIMHLANIDPLINLDTYEPKNKETVIYVPLYNTVTGLCHGLTKKLGLITLRGDAQERGFFLTVIVRKRALFCIAA